MITSKHWSVITVSCDTHLVILKSILHNVATHVVAIIPRQFKSLLKLLKLAVRDVYNLGYTWGYYVCVLTLWSNLH